MPQSIVLTGPMGSGKTSVGRLLAEKTGYYFVDLDEVIVKNSGRTISQIFDQDGEPAFRQMESEALAALAGRTDIVLSTGGGSVLLPENRELMRKIGKVVNLIATVELLASRLSSANDRPLLKGGEGLATTIADLLYKREQCYADCDLRIDTTGKSVEDVAAELLRSI